MLKEAVAPFCKWGPCFWLNAVRFHPRHGVQLLVERVDFDLVHSRNDFIEGDQIGKPIRMEVTDPNSANFSCPLQLLHRPPGP